MFNDQYKYKLSRWMIFISVLLSIIWQIYYEIGKNSYTDISQFNPNYIVIAILGMIPCIVFIYGLFLGSRGLREPLTIKLFLHLIFSYPTRIILVPYLVLELILVFYYEILW